MGSLRLPEPMLARSGPIPSGAGWRFEPKLDGYRCLVCTHGRFRARSRRGWNMAGLLQELAHALPPDMQLDGELVRVRRVGQPLLPPAGPADAGSGGTASPSPTWSSSVVARRDRDRYRPGERLWVKTKNRATARFAEELAGFAR
jgi:ATP-dependent DNA ligase